MATVRPVVLLHGCGGTRRATFEATGWLKAFAAAGRDAIALDLPGHGLSAASRDPAAYADLAGMLATALPQGPFDGVGFSLGAKLLLELAARDPHRIGRLVLGGVGDNVFAPERVAEAAAQALERGPTPQTPPGVMAFLKTWEPDWNDALAIAAVLRRPPNPSFTPERLWQITSPALIVNGTEDPAALSTNRLVGSLPNVCYVTLPGVDHFGLPKQPEFLRVALAFITSAAESEHELSQAARAVSTGSTPTNT